MNLLEKYEQSGEHFQNHAQIKPSAEWLYAIYAILSHLTGAQSTSK